MFSGFYVALLLILFFLIVRVVSFEWRSKSESPAGGRPGRGRIRSAASAPRCSGASDSRISCTASRSTRTATSPATSWISSARTACSRASRSLLFAFHGATLLTLRTRASCTTAPNTRHGGSRYRRGARRRFVAWTSPRHRPQRRGSLPPAAPRRDRDRGARAGRLRHVRGGASGRAFSMTGFGAISRRRHAPLSLYPRVMVSITDFGGQPLRRRHRLLPTRSRS